MGLLTSLTLAATLHVTATAGLASQPYRIWEFTLPVTKAQTLYRKGTDHCWVSPPLKNGGMWPVFTCKDKIGVVFSRQITTRRTHHATRRPTGKLHWNLRVILD